MVLRFAGLPAGRTASLTIDSEATLSGNLDARCTRTVNRTRTTCQVSGDDLSPVVLILVAPQGGQVTATLSPVEQDADLGNNTWRADLG